MKTLLTLLLIVTVAGNAFFAEAQKRPNILVIISDDHNTNTIGCYNGSFHTPGIDRIANEGIRFTRAYTNASLCVPTRYACLTGSYASRSVNPNYGPLTSHALIANGAFFTDEEKTIAMALKKAGYYTGATGKWHNATPGSNIDFNSIPKDANPRDDAIKKALAAEQKKLSDDIKKFGFDYADYLTHSNLDAYPDALAHHNVEYTVKGAIEFLENVPEDKPFFLWTAFTTSHGPRERIDIVDVRLTPEGYTEKHLCIRPEIMAERSDIISSCDNPGNIMEQTVRWMDNGIDIILKKLDDMGLTKNTLVIFLSDQQNTGKSTPYECGQKIAFIIRYPAAVEAGGVSNALVDITDMAATILHVADAPAIEGMQMDGQNMAPLWDGTKQELKSVIFSEMGYSKAVVNQDFKYIAIRYPEWVLEKGIPPDTGSVGELSAAGKLYMLRNNTPFGQKNTLGLIDADQLYDLRTDPDEQINLARIPEYAETLEEMKASLADFIQDIGRPFGEFK